jgi:hypothetical protein
MFRVFALLVFLFSNSAFTQEAVNFFELAKNGNISKIQSLVNYGFVDVNEKSPEGKTALMYAAENGNSRTASVLLDLGANMDEVDNNGNTALMYAIKHGKPEAALRLIKRGASLEGVTGLMISEFKASNPDNKAVNEVLAMLFGQKEIEALNRVRKEHDEKTYQQTKAMLISYVFGDKAVMPTDIELLDAFIEKILQDLSSGEEANFNFASSLLANKDVINFLEEAQLYVYINKTASYPEYNKILALFRGYADLDLITSTETSALLNNPDLLRVKNEYLNDMKRAMKIYRSK